MQPNISPKKPSVGFSLFLSAPISGACFVAALLIQIVSGQIGVFNLAGSILTATAFMMLIISALGSLILAWVKVPESIAQASGALSWIGLASAAVASVATLCYAAFWVHPAENILGGNDAGIYSITAANLANTGYYRLNASLLPSLPADLKPWILDEQPKMANRTEKPPAKYPCYQACLFIADEKHGVLSSQFPIGFPALLGSMHALLGFAGQRLVNPLLLFVTACLAGLLATSWLGKIPGMTVFVFWLWFPLLTWGGNSRYAEILLMSLWILTLLGLAERKFCPFWSGGLAGLALGVSLAVKIDALPVVAIVALVAVPVTYRHEPIFCRTFFLTLLISAGISTFTLWEDNRAYAWDTLRSLIETNRKPFVGVLILVVAGGLTWYLARLWRSSLVRICVSWPDWRSRIEWCAIICGLILAAYAFFLRSNPDSPDSFFYWPQNRVIPSYREETFVRLGWYWQPWGLAISVLGIGALLRNTERLWQGLLIGVGLLFLIAFSYDIRNNPIQPYALRRFLPYAVPVMIFGAAGAGHWVSVIWQRSRAVIAVVIAGSLLLGFWKINECLNGHVEYPGLIDQATSLASKIPANSVVLISESEQLVRLASGLEFVFGKPCLIVRRLARTPGREIVLRMAIRTWQEQGKTVFVLSPRSGEKLGVPDMLSKSVTQGLLQTKNTFASEQSLVTEQTAWQVPYFLNELIAPSPSAPAAPHRAP